MRLGGLRRDGGRPEGDGVSGQGRIDDAGRQHRHRPSEAGVADVRGLGEPRAEFRRVLALRHGRPPERQVPDACAQSGQPLQVLQGQHPAVRVLEADAFRAGDPGGARLAARGDVARGRRERRDDGALRRHGAGGRVRRGRRAVARAERRPHERGVRLVQVPGRGRV